jgi:hypothetical protein
MLGQGRHTVSAETLRAVRVMPFGEARALAAGVAATAVASFQRPADRCWNAPSLAADIERLAVLAVFELAPMRFPMFCCRALLREYRLVDVHHGLRAVREGARSFR